MADTKLPPTLSSREARSSSVSSSIFLDMADTSWRLFIPTVGLLLFGRHLDVTHGTKPWLMLLGVTIGAIIAAFLIKRQLQRGGETK
ncbi:MAG: AtpZ/AtpI family protein [Candidatus Saccharimonadales bacterium]